ncbi:unnamed protein product [Heterobilharzia americana]|nr:unnamed protein product [Heterobilharzia americana]CAH8615585.1 unnamed protein product [Heterobilharzia americana]
MTTRTSDRTSPHQDDRDTAIVGRRMDLQEYVSNYLNTNRMDFNFNPFTMDSSLSLFHPQLNGNTLLPRNGQFCSSVMPYQSSMNLNCELSQQQQQQQYFIGESTTDQSIWHPALIYLAAATQFILRHFSLHQQEEEQRQQHIHISTYPQSQTQCFDSFVHPTNYLLNSSTHHNDGSTLQLLQSQPSEDTSIHGYTTNTMITNLRMTSNNNNNLTKIEENLSSRIKRYQCTYPGCSKAYYKRSHLNEHFHLHTGVKPHLCNQPGCGARFTRADQLSRHRRAHTGERNFFCTVCSKRFKRSDHLKVHLARNVCTKPIS